MSQQTVAEPSEKWKQLLHEHLRVVESGRVRVPTMDAGWSRGIKTFGASGLGLGLVEAEGNGVVCLEGSEWGEDVAVRGQPPWTSSLIVRTFEFSIPTPKREEGMAHSTTVIINISVSATHHHRERKTRETARKRNPHNTNSQGGNGKKIFKPDHSYLYYCSSGAGIRMAGPATTRSLTRSLVNTPFFFSFFFGGLFLVG